MLSFISLSFLSLETHALNMPKSSMYDPRVRNIMYNPQDVVQIETVIGIATHIVLEEGEQYITHAFGDAEAWSFAVELNHYFIKPVEEQADTNLTIVTDKRTYYFRLHYNPTRDALAMYGVKFHYPENNAKAIRKSIIDKQFNVKKAGYNLQYTMSGDFDIAPLNVWDDKEFTYFKFHNNNDMPGIYMVDAEGKESIVNRHTIGDANDIIVVHKVNPKWVLRLSNRALAIYNEAYDADGIRNTSRTAAPHVMRVIKGAN